MTVISDSAVQTSTPESAASAPRGRRRRPISWGKVAAWSVLVVIMFITLFPFYWMLRTALSTNSQLFLNPGDPFPTGFSWGGFRRVLGLASPEEIAADGGTTGTLNFWLYLRNSVIVSTVITVGQVFSVRWPLMPSPGSGGPGATRCSSSSSPRS